MTQNINSLLVWREIFYVRRGCYDDVFVLVVLGVVECFACFPSTAGSTEEFDVKLNYLARSACQCGATDCKTTLQVLQEAGWDGLYQISAKRYTKTKSLSDCKPFGCAC